MKTAGTKSARLKFYDRAKGSHLMKNIGFPIFIYQYCNDNYIIT